MTAFWDAHTRIHSAASWPLAAIAQFAVIAKLVQVTPNQQVEPLRRRG
jgi:hypothetical protein